MPLSLRGYGLLVWAAVVWNVCPVYAQPQPSADGLQHLSLTFRSQTVWQGEYGWCTFSAGIDLGKGGVSFRCGGAGPFGTASPGPGAGEVRRRKLTDSETTTLRNLYEAARLFDDGHIGADYSASDFPFTILIVRSSPPNSAVVLVLTGNPTFSNGPRKALIDWWVGERQAIIAKKRKTPQG